MGGEGEAPSAPGDEDGGDEGAAGELSGEGEGEVPAYSGLRCGMPFGQEDLCGGCAEERCCDVARACADAPGCGDSVGCFTACAALAGEGDGGDGDPVEDAAAACRRRCRDEGPALGSQVRVQPLLACLATECAQECGECGPTDLFFGDECSTCFARSRNACEHMATCVGEEACTNQLACFTQCKDPLCNVNCPDSDGDLADALIRLVRPARLACRAACGIASAWECVDGFEWGTARDDEITVSVEILNLVTGAPVAGLDIAACHRLDPLCANPLDEAETGADGTTSVKVPLTADPTGFPGYIQVTGGFIGDQIVPMLLFYNEPLVRDLTLFGPAVDVETAGTFVFLATGVERDPFAGALVAQVFDCRAHQAEGVSISLTLDPGVPPAYVSAVVPDLNLQATSTDGLAVFSNIPIGQEGFERFQLAGRLESSGEVVTDTSVIVRPDFQTYVVMNPRSR